MHLEPYEPRQTEQFWCSVCDAKPVDSDKPETGRFFVQFGHTYKQSTRQYDGNYVGVMFALCSDCIKK